MLFPVQDVFGWLDRVNEPATINETGRFDCHGLSTAFRMCRKPANVSRRFVSGAAPGTGAYNFTQMATPTPFRALRPEPRRRFPHRLRCRTTSSAPTGAIVGGRQPAQLPARVAAEIELPPGYRRARRRRTIAPSVTSPHYAGRRSIVEDEARVYLYRLRMGTHEQTGIAACWALDEYDRDVIKKHERTRRDKEDDRTRHMIAIGAQTGPVFLTYRASPPIDAVVRRLSAGQPLFDFSAPDSVRHEMWSVGGADRDTLVEAFAPLESLYIADGHHRAASAARARDYSSRQDRARRSETGQTTRRPSASRSPTTRCKFWRTTAS